MLQLVYISSATPGKATSMAQILTTSRFNNQRDGITGLLYSDGSRFLQALEGPADKVVATFERIRVDPRHQALVMLSRREIAEREFGPWAMAHRGQGEDADAFVDRIVRLSDHASPNVRATFQSFADLRRGQAMRAYTG